MLLVFIAGFFAARHYVDVRYRSLEPVPGVLFDSRPAALLRLGAWARSLTDSRVAIDGFYLHYPLYGTDLSNRVSYVGQPGDHGGIRAYSSCSSWRRALNRGRYQYVITAPQGWPYVFTRNTRSPRARWTASDPTARPVERLSVTPLEVFRIASRLRERC